MLSEAVTVTAPASEPVTLEQAKTFLRIDGDALDEELALFIAAARGEIEELTGLRLVDQVVRVTADSPSDLAHLALGPVVAIEAAAPGDVADYQLTGAGLVRGLRVPTGGTSPITVDLKVGFGAGPEQVPAPLRLALLLIMRARREEKEPDVDRLLIHYRLNA